MKLAALLMLLALLASGCRLNPNWPERSGWPVVPYWTK